jgi:hypothetical protein
MEFMRYFLSLILLIFIFLGCSVNKQPVFKKVDNIKIVSISADTIRLKADAFFENPNDVGGKISTDAITIFANDIEVAQISSNEFKVPAKDSFQIPLQAKIPTKKLLNTNKNGVLGGLLNSLFTLKVTIRIKGNLEYVVFGFKKEFLVDKTEDIKIEF